MAEENQVQPPAQQENPGLFMSILNSLPRLVLMYMAMNYFFGNKAPTVQPKNQVVTKDGQPQVPTVPHVCLFRKMEMMNLDTFFSTSNNITFENKKPFWSEKSLVFANSDQNNRRIEMNITENNFKEEYKTLSNNGTVYIHAFLTKPGASYDPKSINYDKTSVVHLVKQLNRYKFIKGKKRKNLLSSTQEEKEEKQEEKDRYSSLWNKDVFLTLVDFNENFNGGSMPANIADHVKFDENNQNYYPVFYVNDFWTLKDNLIELNQTIKEIPLNIELYTIGILKWQMYVQMDVSLNMQKSMGTAEEGDQEEMKRMFLETNPYLLATTMIVTLLHTIFDFLAFKNDIQFWNNKKNVEGLSIRTLFVNFVMQVIIFLYLLDNETSWMILISSFIGLGIEVWKIKNAVEFKRIETFPFISFDDKESYTNSKTKEYDDLAMTYLSYFLYPSMILYSIYSLVYNEHKGWYSFIISTLVGFIYMFGFIMMTPQLFINYKLKSVAHMPWKAFMYKALNTFIDDLFAFVIKMPMLHRLSCFRDDIIFFIYLYQRWIYRVDKKRVNEFGQQFEPDEEEKKNENENENEEKIEPKDEVELNKTSEDQEKEPKDVENDEIVPLEEKEENFEQESMEEEKPKKRKGKKSNRL
eukprot:gene10048-2367_t